LRQCWFPLHASFVIVVELLALVTVGTIFASTQAAALVSLSQTPLNFWWWGSPHLNEIAQQIILGLDCHDWGNDQKEKGWWRKPHYVPLSTRRKEVADTSSGFTIFSRVTRGAIKIKDTVTTGMV
jgi:hypothetical protein